MQILIGTKSLIQRTGYTGCNILKEMQINENFGLPAIDEGTAKVINYIFKRLKGCIPALKYHADCMTSLDSIRAEYTYAFMRSGIGSINAINRGIDKLVDNGSKFLPAPGEFIKLCKAAPEDINAPSVKEAYYEACLKSHPSYGDDKKWTHPAVEMARNTVRPYKLNNLPEKETYKEFESAYLDACSQLSSGCNTAQIEQSKKDLTPTEVNWVLLYKKCIQENIDPRESTFFPCESLIAKAEALYNQGYYR